MQDEANHQLNTQEKRQFLIRNNLYALAQALKIEIHYQARENEEILQQIVDEVTESCKQQEEMKQSIIKQKIRESRELQFKTKQLRMTISNERQNRNFMEQSGPLQNRSDASSKMSDISKQKKALNLLMTDISELTEKNKQKLNEIKNHNRNKT